MESALFRGCCSVWYTSTVKIWKDLRLVFLKKSLFSIFKKEIHTAIKKKLGHIYSNWQYHYKQNSIIFQIKQKPTKYQKRFQRYGIFKFCWKLYVKNVMKHPIFGGLYLGPRMFLEKTKKYEYLIISWNLTYIKFKKIWNHEGNPLPESIWIIP